MKKIDKKNIEDIFALTSMQEGMLFHYLKDPGNNYYFEQLCLDIDGEIDVEIFKKSWDFVIKSNEMLRAVFRWEKMEKPLQMVLKNYPFQPVYYDLHDIEKGSCRPKIFCPLPAGVKNVEEIKHRDLEDKFDLRDVPFRIILEKIKENRYRLIITNHHILYDGWSTGIILKEFFQTYDGLFTGNQLKKPVKTKFKEFVRLIQKRGSHEAEKKFWRNHLDQFDTATGLPVTREKIKDAPVKCAGTFSICLEKDTRTKLEGFIKNYKITLATFMYSAWGLLLQKYNNVDDVIFGTTVSGRPANLPGVKDMVGLFINTIPLRVRAFPGEKIADWLCRMDSILKTRGEYEQTSLLKIKEYSGMVHQQELFDTIVVVENYPLDSRLKLKNSKIAVDSYTIIEKTHYKLTVGIEIWEDIRIVFNYSRQLFTDLIIQELAGHFKCILQEMMQAPNKEAAGIEMLTKEEKRQLLVDFNRTQAGYPANKTIQRLFEEQAEQTPDHVALIGEMQRAEGNGQSRELSKKCRASCSVPCALTYRQLNEKAGQMARFLIQKGVENDTIAAIMMKQSVEMIIGILGILKAGGAYMPIDPGYPEERIEYMLTDSSARVLLTSASLEKKVKKIKKNPEIIFIDCDEFPASSSSHILNFSTSSFINLAYLIYTSGSTGKPKGVLVEQGGMVNTIYWRKQEYRLGTDDRVLQLFSFCFDGFVTSFFTPLVSGSPVVLETGEVTRDVSRLKEIIVTLGITHFICVPSLYWSLLGVSSAGDLRSLRVVTLAGERLNPVVVKKSKELNPQLELVNEYGATENTVVATICRDIRPGSTILIGKPIANTRVYLLDRQGHLVPIEVPGELWVGGDGIARGYLNNPGLTAQSFITYGCNRSYMSYILYRTGDLARWLPGGNIEFLGRLDQQVKIRGYRIELGEIRSRLLCHSDIKEAVVTAGPDKTGENMICAYIVPAKKNSLDVSQLRNYLQEKLPSYMIPSHFVRLEKIPLTSTGKLHLSSLPEPGIISANKFIPPRDDIEKILAGIWSRVLGIDREKIGIGDNFFEMGGHSLKSTSLVSLVHQQFDVIVPLTQLVKTSHIRGLAAYIKNAVRNKFSSIELVEKKEYYMVSSAQKRMYILQQMDAQGIAYNIPSMWKLGRHIQRDRFEDIFLKLIHRHESLRTSFPLRENDPVQVIGEHVDFGIEYFELDCDSAMAGQGESNRLAIQKIIRKFVRRFQLSQAPLLRAGLIKSPGNEYIMILDIHHIISDGVSINVLIKEFRSLYNGEKLSIPRIQYKDYSQWYDGEKQKESRREQETYWLKQFEKDLPVLNMPMDYPRPAAHQFEGNIVFFGMEKDLTGKIRNFVKKTGTTIYMLLLGVLYIVLSKYTRQEDIIIGSPVTGRRHPDLQETVGMFVNMLALRNRPGKDKTFKEFLWEIKKNVLDAIENQDYQFEELVERLSIERVPGRNPLFDVVFEFQNLDSGFVDDTYLELGSYITENLVSRFDLLMGGRETDDTIRMHLYYSTVLYKKSRAEKIVTRFQEVLTQVMMDNNIKLKDLRICSDLLEVKSTVFEEDQMEEDFEF